MKQTINESEFVQAFSDYHRADNFTYEGLCALFNWLEEYEDSCDTEIELDVIELCCDFKEYESMEELKENYTGIQTMGELEEHTLVIPIGYTERFIIQNF